MSSFYSYAVLEQKDKRRRVWTSDLIIVPSWHVITAFKQDTISTWDWKWSHHFKPTSLVINDLRAVSFLELIYSHRMGENEKKKKRLSWISTGAVQRFWSVNNDPSTPPSLPPSPTILPSSPIFPLKLLWGHLQPLRVRKAIKHGRKTTGGLQRN